MNIGSSEISRLLLGIFQSGLSRFRYDSANPSAFQAYFAAKIKRFSKVFDILFVELSKI
jgi:hypothetical protein